MILMKKKWQWLVLIHKILLELETFAFDIDCIYTKQFSNLSA